MSGKNILQIVKTITGLGKIFLRIVMLETGFQNRSRKCQEKVYVNEPISSQDATHH